MSISALEIALRPKNTLFLFCINVGAILIYYVVTRLILEQNKTLELREKNHQLTMQAMQYENLQEKISDARRAKHDVRHHIALLQEYLNNGELDALREYLNRYNESLRVIPLSASVKTRLQTPSCFTLPSRPKITA